MAGLLQADFIQPQSNTGLFILSPTGSTMATVNTAGIYSSTGAQMLNASGNFGSPTANTLTVSGSVSANTLTVTGTITGNTAIANTLVLNGSTSGSVSLVAPAVAGSNTATLPAATGTVMVSGAMPAFSAYSNTNQTVTNSTYTKVQINTKEFDTNTNYDAVTNYRFTPTVAGYYQINLCIFAGAGGYTAVLAAIYKNGTIYKLTTNYAATAYNLDDWSCVVSSIIYFNGSTDYIEPYAYLIGSTPTVNSGIQNTYFNGSLVRGA